MRAFLLVAVLGIGTTVEAGPRLELEVGAGAAGWTQATPTFTGRIGVDLLGWFTPSLRVMTTTPISGEQVGLSALGEFRVHTPGFLQLTAGVGVGVATASFSSRGAGIGGIDATVARVNPYLWGDIGLRVMITRLWVGLSVGGAPLASQWMGLLSVGVAFGD